jgi:hypothetical protein
MLITVTKIENIKKQIAELSAQDFIDIFDKSGYEITKNEADSFGVLCLEEYFSWRQKGDILECFFNIEFDNQESQEYEEAGLIATFDLNRDKIKSMEFGGCGKFTLK